MKKVVLSVLMILSLVSSANAISQGTCELSQTGTVKVSWKAYKTPSKIGVGGVFDNVKYTPVAKSGNSFGSILVGSKVVIDTTSVNSNNRGRDAKLVQFFFGMMSGKNIDAKIVDIKADKNMKHESRTGMVTVEVTMNGVTKTVPMKYSFSNGMFNANGVIDILDFSANKALSSINKACFELHKGKTWSDVSIGFSTKIDTKFCN
jgi:polyisoprenoid-binding protein YceI